MKMNLANKLTVLRMILVPIFVVIGYLGSLGVISGEWLGIPTSFWIIKTGLIPPCSLPITGLKSA